MTYQEILDAARSLSVDDRLRLVDELQASVPVEQWPRPSDDWMAEVRRRSAEIDAGTMATSPWNEVRDRTRRKAGFDG